jgi:GNAT superfamily N-acetyltransferase
MIRQCDKGREFEQIYTIINDGALAYKGVIPEDCWTEPYMSRDKLQHEIDAGVVFWGSEENGRMCGVMGLQSVRDVTLVRHAYVLTTNQRRGVGASLLSHLRELTKAPMLIGTWADAAWAIKFYEKNGFELVGRALKDRLLRQYWTVSPRQAEVSVVLADADWLKLNRQL